VGWDLRHQVLRPLLAYCTAPDDRWRWLWRNWWNEDWQGKPKYSEKTCPSAILSTTNPTWPDPCPNTGGRGGKPATNRLSYGAAFSGPLNMSYTCVGSLSGFVELRGELRYLIFWWRTCVCIATLPVWVCLSIYNMCVHRKKDLELNHHSYSVIFHRKFFYR
jgi:hypothetical protein